MKTLQFRVIYIPMLAICFLGMLHAGAQNSAEKIALKVLYVGYSPEKPMPAELVYYMTPPVRYEEIYKTRMAAFRSFLEKNFTGVETVDVRDYNVKMSDKADVTILDAGPVKIPADFNRPMILMSAMAPLVGLPLGLKFDWYCQCLDADALNLRTAHPIFNTPNKVQLTLVDGTTPASFFNGFEGKTTPAKMPMWKVVKEGMTSEKKYLIGMVAHGEGFDDSPDAEAISGGVCWKNAEAVSIGRHGNYFMWGFAGSPDFMTDEAKQVFVNSICYIQKFDRMPVIVKKVQVETRTGLDELMYRLDEDLYKGAIASRKEGNDRLRKMQEGLRERKAKGEDIGKGNENLLKMPLTNEVQSFEDYVKGFAGPELFALYGTDMKLYHKHYTDNYEYYYPSGLNGPLKLDKDAQKLGISNRKTAILEKCISMLEKHQDPVMAQRVLERYTTQKFKTAGEWKKWFTANKGKLFYTEAGGFKFMVNTYSQPLPAASQKQKATVSVKKNQLPTASDPVVISAEILPGKTAGMKEVVINAQILKGWHIYAYASKESPFIITESLLELPQGASSDKEWETSAAVPYPGNDDLFVFENSASFKVQVDCSQLQAGSEIKCGLYYQACDIAKCFQPKKKMITLKYTPVAQIGKNVIKAPGSSQKEPEQLSLNQTAPGFTLKTAEGVDIALSSFKGKPVLVEFWASWCMPCRASIPHLKEVYNKYHRTGFDILSVSIDTSNAAWKKAMAQEGMTWQQVTDTYSGEKDNSDVASIYGIKTVPANVLIDANGKIIARDLQGEALSSKLSELFN